MCRRGDYEKKRLSEDVALTHQRRGWHAAMSTDAPWPLLLWNNSSGVRLSLKRSSHLLLLTNVYDLFSIGAECRRCNSVTTSDSAFHHGVTSECSRTLSRQLWKRGRRTKTAVLHQFQAVTRSACSSWQIMVSKSVQAGWWGESCWGFTDKWRLDWPR